MEGLLRDVGPRSRELQLPRSIPRWGRTSDGVAHAYRGLIPEATVLGGQGGHEEDGRHEQKAAYSAVSSGHDHSSNDRSGLEVPFQGTGALP